MVLNADHTISRKTVLCSISPFTAGLTGKPIVSPGLKLKNLFSIEPVFYMSIVKK